LEVLRQLPVGTILDGELVRLGAAGRADFGSVLRRHQLASPRKIRWAAQSQPVTYMAFDLLKLAGRCLLAEPLMKRRELLQDLLSQADYPGLQMSAAVTGAGTVFFRRAANDGHEGVMAKRLDSRYQPGKRSPAWQKIKPREETLCVVVGYRAGRDGRLQTLLVAGHFGMQLCYLGQVRPDSRSEKLRELPGLLNQLRCREPLVLCPRPALWVRPELYCRVRHFGRTERGRLRFPCLTDLVNDE
jgi:ATP-dependent DNA ligase